MASPLLRVPPGWATLPAFDKGWLRADGGADPYISYVGDRHAVNWSAELEELHEEASREHFIDVWTRRSMLARLGTLSRDPVIVDLGCSTGYLLEDLRLAYPDAQLTGVDLVAAGLLKAHLGVPDARLLQADVCALPLEDQSVDAAVSANLLEHVPDDRRALSELCRVLRPGARGVLVVPAGPSTYDYYDRFLGHERRYARGGSSQRRRSGPGSRYSRTSTSAASCIRPSGWSSSATGVATGISRARRSSLGWRRTSRARGTLVWVNWHAASSAGSCVVVFACRSASVA